MRNKNDPFVLSVAGFDGTSGAGILSDIKVFEAHRIKGLGVITANTLQTHDTFIEPLWIDIEIILDRLKLLLSTYRVKWAKIGVVESLESLEYIVNMLVDFGISIVWDPIIKSSSGFELLKNWKGIEALLTKMTFITPNWGEAIMLSDKEDGLVGSKELSKYTNVYLKGGHNPKAIGKDYLFYNDKQYTFNPKKQLVVEKHGSGCVFSSAFTANLTKQYPIIKTCLRSKSYTFNFLNSSKTAFGRHKI